MEMQNLEFKETSGHFNPYQGLNFGGQARNEATAELVLRFMFVLLTTATYF